jgi:bacteriorhodopsin
MFGSRFFNGCRLLPLMVALLAVPVAAEPPAWQVAGTLGMMQFVVVSESRVKDRAVYDEAIAALCQSTCFLRFFTNSANAALSVPLPDAILAEPAAMYQRSAKQGNEIFQWSCRLGIAGGNCF